MGSTIRYSRVSPANQSPKLKSFASNQTNDTELYQLGADARGRGARVGSRCRCSSNQTDQSQFDSSAVFEIRTDVLVIETLHHNDFLRRCRCSNRFEEVDRGQVNADSVGNARPFEIVVAVRIRSRSVSEQMNFTAFSSYNSCCSATYLPCIKYGALAHIRMRAILRCFAFVLTPPCHAGQERCVYAVPTDPFCTEYADHCAGLKTSSGKNLAGLKALTQPRFSSVGENFLLLCRRCESLLPHRKLSNARTWLHRTDNH